MPSRFALLQQHRHQAALHATSIPRPTSKKNISDDTFRHRRYRIQTVDFSSFIHRRTHMRYAFGLPAIVITHDATQTADYSGGDTNETMQSNK